MIPAPDASLFLDFPFALAFTKNDGVGLFLQQTKRASPEQKTVQIIIELAIVDELAQSSRASESPLREA